MHGAIKHEDRCLWSQRFEATIDQLNIDTFVLIDIFEVYIEHIRTVGTYNQVRPTSLGVSLVIVATNPLVSGEEVTFIHIVLFENLNIFEGSTLSLNMINSERYYLDFR
jgi:hypothetical protein